MNFYIDVSKLYEALNGSDNFQQNSHAIESLGALSIFTGNDKSPGIRHITKSLALNVYQDACTEGILPSLVDAATGKLTNSTSCKDAFLLLLARIYFHMYRVSIRKLSNITWDVVISNGEPNFKLLRDIGCQYAKGQLDKTPPVDGALDQIFLRAVFQANEYDQIFAPSIDYLNPLEYGFEEHKGGLQPVLNKNRTPQQQNQVVIRHIDEVLFEDLENSNEPNDYDLNLDLHESVTVDCQLDNEETIARDNISLDNITGINASNILDVTVGQLVADNEEPVDNDEVLILMNGCKDKNKVSRELF
eukprot:Seg18087.1 transcript_id=Seg18087.1/GoldUCD/mRNA.D3Y31 product="hypothetical protein" protein_id=Seg18087.1/GoldUCD/D3Y31